MPNNAPANVIPLHGDRAIPLQERDDDALVLLARGGQAGAFDVLIRRHQAQVLRVAARMLADPSAALDAAQNTFVEVYRYLPRYQPQGQFKAFLFKVLRNQCLMLARSRPKAIPMEDPSRLLALEPAPNAGDDTVLTRERNKDLDRALHQLSDKLRAVVVLRFAGDCSLEEVATSLNLPVGTVKSRLFAALADLRKMMGGKRP